MSCMIQMFDVEVAAADAFTKKHRCKKGSKRRHTYLLSPTGIGLKVVVRCDECQKTKDVTDYDSW